MPSSTVQPRSHRRARSRLASMLIAVFSFSLVAPVMAPQAAFAQNMLPALGDSVSDDLGVGVERKIGDSIMREIRQDPDYVDDPIELEYITGIFDQLLAAARKRGEVSAEIDQHFAWEPFLVRDRTFNAFALPGGYMGIHLGLIAVTANRDELASVIAHELSHVTQRHIARGVGNSKKASLIGVATMLAGIIAATRGGGGQAASALITGGQAAAIQGQLNYSRDMEREADRVGFQVMSTAGFAPRGMADMFEKLEVSSRLNDSGGFPYLRTHPLTSERIGEAKSRLGSAPPVVPVSVLEHTAAEARSRVLMDTRVDSLHHWQSQDADISTSTPDRLAAAYESALASTMLREWSRADASLQKLDALMRNLPVADPRAQRAVALLNVQSMLERGDAVRATQWLKPYATEASRPVELLSARIAMIGRAGNEASADAVRRSTETLQTRVAVHPNDAESWTVLAQLWSRTGQPLRSLRAEAEARAALGDMQGAIDRLKAGQNAARNGQSDFIEVSVIDSRLRTIEAQRRQMLQDEKQYGY